MARDEGINVPESDNEARVKLGTLLINNQTGAELLALAEEMFGTQKSVQATAEASKTGTACVDNEG
jgi:hypothetical protein